MGHSRRQRCPYLLPVKCGKKSTAVAGEVMVSRTNDCLLRHLAPQLAIPCQQQKLVTELVDIAVGTDEPVDAVAHDAACIRRGDNRQSGCKRFVHNGG